MPSLRKQRKRMKKKKTDWETDGKVGTDKTTAAAEAATKVTKTTKKTSVKAKGVKPEATRKSVKKEPKVIAEQTVPAIDKKKLPQVILVYEDKNGRKVTKTYTCYELNIYENIETHLNGVPSSRKDIADISIDAKVVGIE